MMRTDVARIAILATVALCLCGCGDGSQVTSAGSRAIVDAARYVDRASPTCGLQAAIDAAGSAKPVGGIVVLPPGVYPLRRSLVLSAGLTLRGCGASTVLRYAGGTTGALVGDCKIGGSEVELADPSGFRVGDEITLRDADQAGWNCHKAVVTSVTGRRVGFTPAAKQWYRVEAGATACNAFPSITADRQDNLLIESLRIEGAAASQPGEPPFDFVNDAIHLVRCSGARVRDVTVVNWPADGIGIQGGSDNQVIGCSAIGCRGHGFHPGTLLTRSVFTGNVARGNGQDGLYFCELVRSCTVSNNVFSENGGNGIGGLGIAWGQWNVCGGNVCDGNGRAGIECWGLNNVVTGNVCVNNSQSAPGKFAGIVLINANHALIASNRCGDNQTVPTQWTGIAETEVSDENLFHGNVVSGSRKGLVRIGAHSVAEGNLE